MSATTFEKRSGNDALQNNPFNYGGFTNNHITVRGSDWYFAVTAVMIASTAAFICLAFTKPQSQRIFHYITAAITMIASIAYFSMGSNLGWTGIQVEFLRSDPKVAGNVRQIFYVRYIDWFCTTPLLLLDLMLTAGFSSPTILYTILINEIMVVTGLIGALVRSSYKWGYFTFGCAAFLFVAYAIVFEGRSHSRALGQDINKVFTICGCWTIGLWFLYPIAWGICEGANVIPSDSEAIFYGILDILAKPVFGALLLWGHRNIDINRFGLDIRDPSDPKVSKTARAEKNGIDQHHNNSATNGTTSGTDVPQTV